MNKKDYRFFEFARQEAEKSQFERFHVGCVIVYKGHIIGRGSNSNKTHPVQKKYNKERSFNRNGTKPIVHSMHAEIAALQSIPYPLQQSIDWSKVKVYTFRICPGKKLHQGMSRCCPGCLKAIRDKGIRYIYYTTSTGYAREEIV